MLCGSLDRRGVWGRMDSECMAESLRYPPENIKTLLISYCCCCSVAQSCLTLCNPMDCSTPGFPVLHHLLKFAQVHVHCNGDAIQPSHPLMPSSSALNLFQHIQYTGLYPVIHQYKINGLKKKKTRIWHCHKLQMVPIIGNTTHWPVGRWLKCPEQLEKSHLLTSVSSCYLFPMFKCTKVECMQRDQRIQILRRGGNFFLSVISEALREFEICWFAEVNLAAKTLGTITYKHEDSEKGKGCTFFDTTILSVSLVRVVALCAVLF